MRRIEVLPGDEIVVDIGHRGPVTGLAVLPSVVVSGGSDGQVLLRSHDGRSQRPALQVAAVTCITMLPGATACVVGTVDGTWALEPETGAHRSVARLAGVTVLSACEGSERAVLGCDDGTIRTLAFREGVRPVTDVESPVRSIAASDGRIVAACEDGRVVLVDDRGRLRWTHEGPPEAATAVAFLGDEVLVVGADPATGEGQVLVLRADGSPGPRHPLTAPALAVHADGRRALLALADGTLCALDGPADVPSPLQRVTGPAITVATLVNDEVWFGGADGEVQRLDPPLGLHGHDSGIIAMAFRGDEAVATGSSGDVLRVYDLVGGRMVREVDLPGVVALCHPGLETEDLVVAHADGRLERRAAPDYRRVTATGNVELHPTALGWIDGRIVAEDETDFATVDDRDLSPSDVTDDQFMEMAIARAAGQGFVGYGPVGGIDVAILGNAHVAVARPGEITLADEIAHVVRVWREGSFVD